MTCVLALDMVGMHICCGFDHASADDAGALAVHAHWLRVWATNAMSLVHAYDPEIAVLGGSVMQSAEPVIPFCTEAAALGNEGVLFDALVLMTEETHGTPIELR